MLSPEIVALVALVVAAFLLAGLVKGAIGMGLPSVVLGVLAIAMAPAQAAALLILPSLVTNVWQMLTGPHFIALLRRMWSLLAASVLGIWLSGGVLTGDYAGLASFGLGLVLIAYAAIGLGGARFSVPPQAEPYAAPLAGFATGLISGATGMFVLPAGPYFQAVGMKKDELVQMLGLSFTVSTVALAAVLWRDGIMQVGNAAGSAAAIAPALAGMTLGARLRARVSAATFERWFFIGLALLGLHQVVRWLM